MQKIQQVSKQGGTRDGIWDRIPAQEGGQDRAVFITCLPCHDVSPALALGPPPGGQHHKGVVKTDKAKLEP